MKVHRLVLYILLGFYESANAQVIASGRIVDAENGQPLFTANIRVKGTSISTISNRDGAFLVKVSELPVTLIITHIGYAEEEILFSAQEARYVKMRPIAYPIQETIVIPNLGSAIMQKVIERKRQRNADLKNFKAMAYTRQVIENQQNEGRIVGMVDLVSEINWDHSMGFREVILSKRHSKNINFREWFRSFAVTNYLKSIPNVYDDEIAVGRVRIIGPTHPDALDFYHFKVRERQYSGSQTIYEISVRPKTKVQPTVTGRLYILDEAFVILRAELEPSPNALLFSPIVNLHAFLLQQFQKFENDVWLPIDLHLHIEGSLSIPGLISIPKVKVRNIWQFKNYEVNKRISAVLYDKDCIISIDSVSVREDSLFTRFSDSMPLTSSEETAYEEIDEELTLRKAFPPSGPLAGHVRMRSAIMDKGKSSSGNGSKIRRRALSWHWGMDYNRVSKTKGSVRIGIANRLIGNEARMFVGSGFAQGPSRWIYQVEFRSRFGNTTSRNSRHVSIRHQSEITERYRSYHYDVNTPGSFSLLNNAFSLFGFDDYYDYYWNKSTDFVVTHGFSQGSGRLSLGLHDADHSSLRKQTDFNILGRHKVNRPNPQIDEGRLRYVDLSVNFAMSRYKRATVWFEWSSEYFFKSDFSYAKYELAIDWRIDTFLKRRAKPNVLDVRVRAGTFSGSLPVQRFGVLDVRRPVTWFGTFKFPGGYPYEGESFFGLYWQHNFRSALFEFFSMDFLARNGFEIILHGASGKTWISKRKLDKLQYVPHLLDDFYHEAGISLGIYNLIRIDATKRLDENGFSIRGSIVRIN